MEDLIEVLTICQPGCKLTVITGSKTANPEHATWDVRAIVDDTMVVYRIGSRYYIERLSLLQRLYDAGDLKQS